MNKIENYVKYDKSQLSYKGKYLTASDLSSTYMDIGKERELSYKSSLANNLGINLHNWIGYILTNVEEISKKAVEASKQNRFSLVCEVNQQFFDVFARTLYYNKGIKVKKVDDLSRPTSIIIEWDKDNGILHPAFNFIQVCKKSKDFTDFDFKIKGLDKSFPCHRLVIAWKTSFYEKGLTGSNRSEMKNKEYYEFSEETLTETVEYLLSYLYEEKKEVSALSLKAVEQVLAQADFLGLTQLKSLCAKDLIRRLNIENASSIAECLIYSKAIQKGFENYFIESLFQKTNSLKDLARITLLAQGYDFPKLETLAVFAQLLFKDSEGIDAAKEILAQSSDENRDLLLEYLKARNIKLA